MTKIELIELLISWGVPEPALTVDEYFIFNENMDLVGGRPHRPPHHPPPKKPTITPESY